MTLRLALSVGGLVWMSAWSPTATDASPSGRFGFGFGLTVYATVDGRWKPRVGRIRRRIRDVTVARMIGMAVGMAALTAFGFHTITASQTRFTAGRCLQQYIPAYLRDRPLHDGLVAQALESWPPARRPRSWSAFLVAAQ